MKYIRILIVMLGLVLPTVAQVNTLTARYEFPSGYALRYPNTWEIEETENGIILRSQDTVLQIIDNIPSYYNLEDLLLEYSAGYFRAYQIRYYALPDGRDAARAEYRDDDGDEAVDIAVEASDGSHAYFVGLTYSDDLSEQDTILAIAASYNHADLVAVPANMTTSAADANRVTVPYIANDYDAYTYVDATCPFYVLPPEQEGQTLQCGYLIVPEEHDNRYSPKIQLAVIQLLSPNPDAEPVIYLEGGPGGSAIAYHDRWYDSALRDQYHIILIDQRGTGFSRPSLDCPEYYDYELWNPVDNCAVRLRAEGINLIAYNSFENAADIAALVTALGYGQANIMGTSYGSRLALTMLRDHPGQIRSIIIEGIFPPTVNAYEQQALNAFRAFDTLLTNCNTDAACRTAYPNLRSEFYQAIRALNDEPMMIYSDYYDQNLYVSGDVLIDDMFSLMYSSEWVGYLPALIHAAYERDSDTFSDLEPPPPSEPDYTEDYYVALEAALLDYTGLESLGALQVYLDDLDDAEYFDIENSILGHIAVNSEGMFHSVTCREEIPFNTLRGFNADSENIPPEIQESIYAYFSYQINACDYWDVPAANARENAAVHSDVPVLLLSGEYDPITPPTWGAIAAETLDSSYHYTVPSMGHGVVDVHPCPSQIALDFLNNPMNEPDTTCLADMGTTFYTP